MELVLSNIVDATVRENQRVKPPSELTEIDGLGPEISERGSGADCGGARSSTSIVAEVSRIVGLPGIGPATLSAATIAMTGRLKERWLEGWLDTERATASLDVTSSTRLSLRGIAASMRFVVATTRPTCGPWLSTRDGLSVAGTLPFSAPESFAGRAGSSVSGATLNVAEDLAGSRVTEVLGSIVVPAIEDAALLGANSERTATAGTACPIGGVSTRSTINDCGGSGDSVEVTTTNPARACGSARLLGSTTRLDTPRRTNDRDESLLAEKTGDGGKLVRSTRAFGFGSDA